MIQKSHLSLCKHCTKTWANPVMMSTPTKSSCHSFPLALCSSSNPTYRRKAGHVPAFLLSALALFQVCPLLSRPLRALMHTHHWRLRVIPNVGRKYISIVPLRACSLVRGIIWGILQKLVAGIKCCCGFGGTM